MQEQPRILVVVADPILAGLLLDLLGAQGHTPRWVASQTEARNAVLERLPDLAILDRRLPDGDGLELCRTLRAQAGQHLKLLVLASEWMAPLDKVEAFTAGADDYLSQPLVPAELLVRIKALLRLAQAQAVLHQSRQRHLTLLGHWRRAQGAGGTAIQPARTTQAVRLANLSHEIRTPLNAVLGFLHLLAATPLAQQQQDYLAKAGRAAQNLHGILENILDFSKIEARRLALEPMTFNLLDTLAELRATLAVKAAAKGLELLFQTDPALPEYILGDPLRLGQVLANLTSNAVKFTDQGHVSVQVDRLPGPEDVAHLRIQVRDTGIGISADQLKRLFQPFSQADASSTRRFGGTGLGLSIAKQLAELMGGTLQAESQPCHGSSFTLDLALPVCASPLADPEPEPGSAWPPPHLPAEPAPAGPTATAPATLDAAGAMVRLELDGTTYRRLLQNFLANQEDGLALLQAALDQGDHDTALRHAHSMKGSAASLGANALSQAARDLERELRAGPLQPGAVQTGPLATRSALLNQITLRLAEVFAYAPPCPVPAQAPVQPGPLDGAALATAIETLRASLEASDSRASHDLLHLESLVQGHRLAPALVDLRRAIAGYDFARGLDQLQRFAKTAAEDLAGV